MKHARFSILVKIISLSFIFCFLVVVISYSQTSVKPTPISGKGTITFNSTDSVYCFLAAEGITYAYYLPGPARTDPATRGTLNALVVYQGNNFFYPSYLGGIEARLNDSIRGPFAFNFNDVKYELIDHFLNATNDTVTANWRMIFEGDTCCYTYRFSVYGQTLTINIIGDSSNKIIGVGFTNAASPDLPNTNTWNNHYVVSVPCLPITNVLYNKTLGVFATLFADWETTNSSGIHAWLDITNTTGYYSQKVTYNTKTNDTLNQLIETAYLSVSSDINNVLPNIVGPVAPNRGKLSDRFFISYFQPFSELNYPHHEIPGQEPYVKYLDGLYNYYGVRDVAFIVKNWSKGQFDFGWPDNWPADDFTEFKGYGAWNNPARGGNDSLLAIRDSIKAKDFLFGLHENYIAANKGYDISKMGKAPNGDTAWTCFYNQGSYSRFLYLLSPSEISNAVNYNKGQMPDSFKTNDFSYLDFATASNPSGPDFWEKDQTFSFVDFNAALPGDNAGKFRHTLSKIRELGGTVSNAYNGCPVQGEGGHQFLYAGYYDDFDGRIETGAYSYNGDGIRGYKAPLLLEFAQKIREKSSSHGAGHIADFYNIYDTCFTDAQVKTYMATELAYGNGGLVSTMNPDIQDHSLRHAQWEQQYLLWVQKMYSNAKPIKTEYYIGSTPYTASEYIKYTLDNNLARFDSVNSDYFMGRVHVVYDNGVEVWVNRNKASWNMPSFDRNYYGCYCYNITKNGTDTLGLGVRPIENGNFILPAENGWLCYSPYWPNGAVWSGPKEIPAGSPGWGSETGGGGVATARIDTVDRPELVSFWIKNYGSYFSPRYRIGWNPDESGNVSGWSNEYIIGGTPGAISEGGDIAIAKFCSTSYRPDMLVFWLRGDNHVGYYKIGRDIKQNGSVSGWSGVFRVGKSDSIWGALKKQGAGVAIADINKNGVKDALFFWIEHIANDYNKAYYMPLQD
jgi:hypothetical protein